MQMGHFFNRKKNRSPFINKVFFAFILILDLIITFFPKANLTFPISYFKKTINPKNVEIVFCKFCIYNDFVFSTKIWPFFYFNEKKAYGMKLWNFVYYWAAKIKRNQEFVLKINLTHLTQDIFNV